MEDKPVGENGYVKNLKYVQYPDDVMDIEWCWFCARCGTKDWNTVCLYGKLLDLVWNGPKKVSDYGSCDKFVHKYSKKAPEVEFKGFKRKLLESTGVIFQQKER